MFEPANGERSGAESRTSAHYQVLRGFPPLQPVLGTHLPLDVTRGIHSAFKRVLSPTEGFLASPQVGSFG
mgnify:CR=1 FL=1